jgi:hypothetical protein
VAAGAPIAVTMAEASAGSPARPEDGRRQCLDHRAEAFGLMTAGAPIAVTAAEATASSSTRPADERRQCLDHWAEALDLVTAGGRSR